jgi:PilZ domain
MLKFLEETPMRSTVLANRRQTRRYAVRIPCQVVRERDFRLIGDAVVDLSMSGMVVTAAHWVFGQSILTGERLIVSFRLPRSAFWIDVEATVTRVARGRRRGENTPSLALEFDPLPLFVKQRMRGAIRRLPPPPPQPRPGRRRTLSTTQALLKPAALMESESQPTPTIEP